MPDCSPTWPQKKRKKKKRREKRMNTVVEIRANKWMEGKPRKLTADQQPNNIQGASHKRQ